MKSNNEVKKITVTFSDGTEKVIQKGFVCAGVEKVLPENENGYSLLFANVSGKELGNFFETVILCAYQLGFINGDEQSENE